MSAPTLAYLWGDDEFAIERTAATFADALAAESGAPLERWTVTGDRNRAGPILGELRQRVCSPVMFGGGTLALMRNVGALTTTKEGRDAVFGLVETVAQGNALVIIDITKSNPKGPSQRRLHDAIDKAGGLVQQRVAPKGNALTDFVVQEARARNLQLTPGAGKTLADRIGGFVMQNDALRSHQSRLASMELDRLALYRPDGPITPDDVAALVPELTPTSLWALTDAIGERKVDVALRELERHLATTPEPVLITVLHARIRDLLELSDRLAAGEALSTAGKPMGINSEYRARTLMGQARNWSQPELVDALDGLIELDALMKGIPRSRSTAAQRKLAFSLWIVDRVGRRTRAAV